MEEGRPYRMNPEVFRAASNGDSSFFENLADSNSSTFLQVTIEKNTVLHVALQFKKIDAAKNIVDLSPKLVYETNSKGNTPLHVAASAGDSSMVRLLIDQAMDVETGGRQQLLSIVNQDGDTALHVAVRYDNFDVVRELINENDPAELAKQVNNAGESALFLAVDRQHYDMASYILSAAPECSYAGRHGMNVLHALVIHTSSYEPKLIPSKYLPRLCTPDIESGKREAVEFFLERPEFMSLINKQDKEGNTPMHLAAINGHIEIACLLRQGTGVDLNATNKGGFTAMDNVKLRMKLRHYHPTIQLWKEGARPSLSEARFQMGIQKLEPEKGSEDKNMSTSQKLEPEGSEDRKMSTSELDYMNQKKQTDLLVATLIATVTFTAGFTVPGGYKSGGVDEGMAVLSKITAFRVFLIANTLAFNLSITSVIIQFLGSTMSMEVVPRRKGLGLTPGFTFYSAVALLVAFISGTYTVVPHSMGITTAVIGCWCWIYWLLGNPFPRLFYKLVCYLGIRRLIILYAPLMEY